MPPCDFARVSLGTARVKTGIVRNTQTCKWNSNLFKMCFSFCSFINTPCESSLWSWERNHLRRVKFLQGLRTRKLCCRTGAVTEEILSLVALWMLAVHKDVNTINNTTEWFQICNHGQRLVAGGSWEVQKFCCGKWAGDGNDVVMWVLYMLTCCHVWAVSVPSSFY